VTALLRVAFLNLLRARRRNALAGGTMALGTAALVLGSGLADGISGQLTRNLVATQTGHVQVAARPLDWVPQNNPFDAYGQDVMPGGEALADRLRRDATGLGVVDATPVLYGRGSASASSRSALVGIVGVRPERETALFAQHVPQAGRALPADDPLATYVAAPIARKLGLEVGDTVSFVIQTEGGAFNSIDAVVCGIFRKAAPWHDNFFYLNLETAQALFDAAGGATQVKLTLRADSTSAAHAAARGLLPLIADEVAPEGTRLAVEPYDRAGRFSFAIVQANQVALLVVSSFLFVAAGVGIVNSMLMSVHERTREIGTLRALGLRRAAVAWLFVLEGFALGVCAAVVGVAAGGAVVLWYAAHGIPMNTMTLAWMAGGDVLYPRLEAASVGRAVLLIVGLSTLAAVYPALQAARLLPREALQQP
jgi:putative ABC transport system permease protein